MISQQLYNELKTRAEDMAESIEAMTDPAAITGTRDQVERMVLRIEGMLEPSQRASMGSDLEDYLKSVKHFATKRINKLRGEKQ